MSNHKLVQKTLKLTAVGAIAFSVLAQPLSFVASAAEVTPNKAEKQLLQATTPVELLTNSKLDTITSNPTSGQFFPGWTTTSIASGTSDLTSPNSIGSQFSMHKGMSNYWIIDSRYLDVLGVYNIAQSDGSKYLNMTTPDNYSNVDRGAIVVYQDVATVVGKEYTLSQSGTYTANDYNTYSTSYSNQVKSINVFASNTNSKERLALVKATDSNQSTTFIAQSTSTRIYAIIGTPGGANSRIQLWQSIDASGNNLFGASLHATGIQPDDITNTAEKITGRVGTGNIAPGSVIQATITNKDGDEVTYTDTVDSTGHFAIDIDTPQAGDTVVISSGEYSVEKTVLDVIAPGAPTVDTIKNTTTQITGKGEANAKVEVLLPNETVVKGATDETGAFNITVPKQTIGSEIKVRLIDAAGNIGEYTTSTVVQDILANPVVTSITPDTTRITGTGVPGATITAKIGNITYSSTVNPEGTFSINIVSKRVAGTVVTIQQSLAEAKSNPMTVTVSDGQISEAQTATDALFVDNDSTKGLKPNTDQAAIDAAQAKIDKVTDPVAKAALQAELDKAQAELDARIAEAQHEAAAKTAINSLFVDNNPANNITPTTNQAAIDAAQAKVDLVTDAAVKVELQAQIDKAQTELDARIAEANAKKAVNDLFLSSNPANDIKDTTTQATIDAAQAKVNLVTDAAVKAELQAQIDKAQTELVARDAEAKLEAAAKTAINDLFVSNNPANNIKDTTTQAAIDAAQAKVNAVTDPTVKAELQAQIDKAQSQIATRTPIDGKVAKYTAGDLNITGTYTGAATALSIDINGKRYYGGTIANGTFKFYVGDKNLKTSDVVTLNLYDANKQIQKSITVPVAAVLKVTITDYKIGDNYLTATYTYPEIAKIGVVVDGTKYWGGDVKDGNVKFFAADKIKNAKSDVTMNFYDASNNLVVSQKVKIATASSEITTADYTVGANNITGTFAGDVRKLAISINGTKYYGGSLATDDTYKFYVLDKKIKATDEVIIYGYDAIGGLLTQKTVTITEK
ncbi:immunoglobulin-like domain-containing protein [Listeria booriae]|uniref:immunoglobulin-like domain-containing protein n=1 Tax=Listeria booriae TaxID=1552123 RepID=UPI00162AD137|nr:immunoglobulin-like domain-containing protein [Listeria booriae]MBC2321930.1 hypothetical protein [Listeria booriae]MCD2205579.1 Ig-like domain-containing protein [Listeria booriae]